MLSYISKYFQLWLILTGKLPSPFNVEYFKWKDSNGNELEFPMMTAITLLSSGLAIVKTCADLNIVRIHIQEGYNFVQFAGRSLIFTPFFVSSAIFRISAISILLAYFRETTILPIAIIFSANIIYGYKR